MHHYVSSLCLIKHKKSIKCSQCCLSKTRSDLYVHAYMRHWISCHIIYEFISSWVSAELLYQIKVINQVWVNMQQLWPLGSINTSLLWHLIGANYQGSLTQQLLCWSYSWPDTGDFIPKKMAPTLVLLFLSQVALYATVTSKKGKTSIFVIILLLCIGFLFTLMPITVLHLFAY